MPIASHNPATGETLREFQALTAAEIETKLALAESAFQRHRRTTFADRAKLMHAAGALLEVERDALARTITSEMGKLLSAAVDEVLKCANACHFYADHAGTFLAEQNLRTDATRSYIRYEPLGAILAVMPWNFPFWQVFRFAAPALMAGNVALLKHAANVPQCALAIEDIFRRAGFEEGCFQALLIETEQTRQIIDDPRVKAVTLTGSERAGAEVASAAARQIKKAVLELGGSDPFIVMPSADLQAALETAVKARMINSGQSCIAAKRFIIADAIYERFISDFAAKMKALRVGDPLDPATEVGPLANEQILAGVDAQVKASIEAGAKLLAGGKRVERAGCFYEPTVLADVPLSAPAAREEIFGPVAAFFRVANANEALTVANESAFGLGASVWTKDGAEQQFFASGIEAGMVFINAMVASDPRIPFGGIKRSGYGRELGAEGIREFVNAKSVV
ncbi:MAG: NAD-dependent succinate-semialdehyde dehydrogenase, partial [Verrucomicrobiota bacterium]|nr:NAD-dependent succinate-semialdehyde dehydrogenase [Verrucomicrobiota bacterium]